MLESRSLEIRDEIILKIENLEEEIDELEKTKFSLFSLFSFIRAKMALYNKKKVLQHLNMNTQKEIDKKLEKEKFDLQSSTNRYNFLKNNKTDEANKRMKPLPENIENIEKIKTSHDYSGAIGELHVIKNLKLYLTNIIC
jgi:D-mannonate dehydratase